MNTLHGSPRGLFSKVAISLVAVISIVLAMTAFSTVTAPDAEAHGAGDFTHQQLFFGTVCPSGMSPTGTQLFSGIDAINCEFPGYGPVGNSPDLCAQAGGVIGAGDWCTFDAPRPCGDRLDYATPVGDGMCVRPVLVLLSLGLAAGELRAAAVPACINSALAQDNGFGLSVGGNFTADGVTYVVTTGEVCGFDCVKGWDMNCDGKFGDFCPSEFDRKNVFDAGRCMAFLGMEPT